LVLTFINIYFLQVSVGVGGRDGAHALGVCLDDEVGREGGGEGITTGGRCICPSLFILTLFLPPSLPPSLPPFRLRDYFDSALQALDPVERDVVRMLKGLDDGVRRTPTQVARMLEIKTKEVRLFSSLLPPSLLPSFPPLSSFVILDAEVPSLIPSPPSLPPSLPSLQLRQIEASALAKLQQALRPTLEDVLACARAADDRDRQGLYTAPFQGRDPVRFSS